MIVTRAIVYFLFFVCFGFCPELIYIKSKENEVLQYLYYYTKKQLLLVPSNFLLFLFYSNLSGMTSARNTYQPIASTPIIHQ